MLRPAAKFAFLALFASGLGIAQDVISAKSGLVYYVEGNVFVGGEGPLRVGASRQLNPGETLFTGRGRAEVLLNPGTVLRVGDATRVRMDGTELTGTRVSIEAGSVVVTIAQLLKFDRVEIDVDAAAVVLEQEGVYRFDADTERVRVYSGRVEVIRLAGASNAIAKGVIAKRGQTVRLTALQLAKFDLGDPDGLQLWAQERDNSGVLDRRWRPQIAVFRAEQAKTPFELARYVNWHVPFEWEAMGHVPGAAGDILEACGDPAPDCSAQLIDVPELGRQIVGVRKGVFAPTFYLYRKKAQGGTTWEFAGAFEAGSVPDSEYRVNRRGMTTYFTITQRGLTVSGVDLETQDWIDLSALGFRPAFSLITNSRFSDQREYETTASIVSWETDPVETIQVEYRASGGRDNKALGTRTAAATFVRKGGRFVFDPSRSTVPETARWGEFDVDGRRLLVR